MDRRDVLQQRRVIGRIESIDVVVAEDFDEVFDQVLGWRLDLRRHIEHAERLQKIQRVIGQLLDRRQIAKRFQDLVLRDGGSEIAQ